MRRALGISKRKINNPHLQKSRCTFTIKVISFVSIVFIFWIVFALYIIPHMHHQNMIPIKVHATESSTSISHKMINSINIPISPRKLSMNTSITQNSNKKQMKNWPIINFTKDNILTKYNNCPQKFPKEIPKMKDLPYICSNLKHFDIHGHKNCIPPLDCNKCIPPHSSYMPWANIESEIFQKQFKITKIIRRQHLQHIINNSSMNGPIIVMVINHGYSYLFYNWICSIDYHSQYINTTDIRHRTLIITTDKESEQLVKDAGFQMVYYPYWLSSKILKKIDKKAAASFALGAHRWLIALQIATVNDLLHLGYDVIIQDTDVIWNYSPIEYLYMNRFKYIDIMMSVDGTNEFRGPGNSGFFIVRKNCKTLRLLDTMMSLIGLILVGRSDQILWNMLLSEKPFRMIHFETLSTDYFVSGYQINLKWKTGRAKLNKHHFVVHVSWTTDQFDKIEKFYNLEHWYFSEEKCPHLYDYNMLPDLAERKWHIRDKTQEQEVKFKKLGLFRDSTNDIQGLYYMEVDAETGDQEKFGPVSYSVFKLRYHDNSNGKLNYKCPIWDGKVIKNWTQIYNCLEIFEDLDPKEYKRLKIFRKNSKAKLMEKDIHTTAGMIIDESDDEENKHQKDERKNENRNENANKRRSTGSKNKNNRSLAKPISLKELEEKEAKEAEERRLNPDKDAQYLETNCCQIL